jgi:hypothetical protein
MLLQRGGRAHPETPSKLRRMHPVQMASTPASFIPSGEQLFNRDFAVSLSQSADVRDRFVDFFLSPVCFWHNSRNGAAVTGDDESLAPLDIV